MARWDPTQYEVYAAHRSRPFDDLLARIPHRDPRLIVDLGCGNGPMTLAMADRWPAARVVGVDNSEGMLGRARELDAAGRVRWVRADIAEWDVASLGEPDLVVTNAALQWVPGHQELIPRWLAALAPGGAFAMQVPGNFDAPSHRIIREVAAARERGGELTGRLRHDHPVGEPQDYADLLAPFCERVDVWETTYLQVLDPAGQSAHPVLDWVKGTALRPLLDVLAGDELDAFLTDLAARLREAYPRRPYGTPFPFRRVFAIGAKAADGPGGRGRSPLIEPPSAPARSATKSGEPTLGLHHVQVACPAGSEDLLRRFYGGVLGLPEVAKPPALAVRGGCWFQVGPQQLHLGVEEGFRPARKAHPCLLVDDVDRVAAAVTAYGGDVRWDDSIPGVRRFHTDDPCGNRVEIQQSGRIGRTH